MNAIFSAKPRMISARGEKTEVPRDIQNGPGVYLRAGENTFSLPSHAGNTTDHLHQEKYSNCQ